MRRTRCGKRQAHFCQVLWFSCWSLPPGWPASTLSQARNAVDDAGINQSLWPAVGGSTGWLQSSGVEERDHRPNATVVVLRFGEAHLRQNAADVLFDGAVGHPQPPGDARIPPPLGQQRQDLDFTG